jgi:D-aminoacyl-tRNA deacylase
LKALLQRVVRASVTVAGETVGSIRSGLAVMVGIAHDDEDADVAYLTDRVLNIRIFSDEAGKFNLSVLDVAGELLLVSQFTLLASTRKGRRPGFDGAAAPDKASALFARMVELLRQSGLKVETGRFQQHMVVEIHNDGPVTIMLDSRERFLPRNG